MMDYFYRYPLLTTVISGLALGAGFIFPVLWPLSFLGVTGLWWFIHQKQSIKSVAVGGLLAFTAKSLLAISWFWYSYPLDWVQFDLGSLEPLVIGYYWITGSIFLGIGGVVMVLGWRYLLQFSQWWSVLLLAVWWVLAEISSAWFFSVFTTAENIPLHTVFSFGYLGYLISFHPWLIMFATAGGVYVLSFIGCTLALTFYKLFSITQKNNRHYNVRLFTYVSLAILFLLHFVPLETDTVSNDTINIAIVDTWFENDATAPVTPQYRAQVFAEAIAAARLASADYIVLPEDSRYTTPGADSTSTYAAYSFLSGGETAVLVDSGVANTSDTYRALRATIYDPLLRKVHTVDKQFLVPQGEYVPYFYRASLFLLGRSDLSVSLQKNFNFRPGPLSIQDALPSHIPAVLFCFESIDPLGVFRSVRNRSVPFVAHPISHAWFNAPSILWHQTDQMLKVQAIFNQVDIISAGNQVAGAWYTKTGMKIAPTEVTSGEGWRVGIVTIPN